MFHRPHHSKHPLDGAAGCGSALGGLLSSRYGSMQVVPLSDIGGSVLATLPKKLLAKSLNAAKVLKEYQGGLSGTDH